MFCGWLSESARVTTQVVLRLTATMMTLALKAQGFQTRTIQEWPSAKTPEVLRGVVSDNHRMLQLADMVRRIAPSRATVLLRGESGTGKELLLRPSTTTACAVTSPSRQSIAGRLATPSWRANCLVTRRGPSLE